jgi:hypothetical protein
LVIIILFNKFETSGSNEKVWVKWY